MKWQSVLLAMAWIALVAPADAEFYRYRDSNGVMRFTDNLVDVPVDQRPRVGRYKEADDDLAPEEKAERARAFDAAVRARTASFKAEAEAVAKKRSEAEAGGGGVIDSPEALRQKNSELFKEYEELNRERDRLKKEKAGVQTRITSSIYNKKVEALNARFADYKKRQARFQKQVDAYNASIDEQDKKEKKE